MRLDVFLKVSRLVKSRSAAHDLCEEGFVKVNGIAARPSKTVQPNDRLLIERTNKVIEVEVQSVPEKKQVSKDEAAMLYKIVAERELLREF